MKLGEQERYTRRSLRIKDLKEEKDEDTRSLVVQILKRIFMGCQM